MTLKPFARYFWAHPEEWPVEREAHVFLGRAVNQLGAAMHHDWQGDEGAALVVGPVAGSDRRTVLALLSRDPSYEVDEAGSNEIADHAKAEAIRVALNEIAQPKVDRFNAVVTEMHRGLMDGRFKSFRRTARGLDPLHPDLWFRDDGAEAIQTCKWLTDDHFRLGYPIFLDRRRFDAWASERKASAPAATVRQRGLMLGALVEIIKESPTRRTHTNEQLRDEIERRSGHRPSVDALNSIKAEAISQTGAVAWAKGGRPKTGEG